MQNDGPAIITDLEANKGEATEEVEKEQVAEGDSSRKSEMATHDENKEKIEDTKETIYSTISKDKKVSLFFTAVLFTSLFRSFFDNRFLFTPFFCKQPFCSDKIHILKLTCTGNKKLRKAVNSSY